MPVFSSAASSIAPLKLLMEVLHGEVAPSSDIFPNFQALFNLEFRYIYSYVCGRELDGIALGRQSPLFEQNTSQYSTPIFGFLDGGVYVEPFWYPTFAALLTG
jgi:hypothetical protein